MSMLSLFSVFSIINPILVVLCSISSKSLYSDDPDIYRNAVSYFIHDVKAKIRSDYL